MELDNQVSKYGLSLTSLYKIKGPERGFLAKSGELGSYGSSYLFHHQITEHAIDKVPCRDVKCGLCRILESGFKVSDTGLWGKGIYFTMNPKSKNSGFVMVCEVLLGNSFYPTRAFEGSVVLPPDTHSVYALTESVLPLGSVEEEEFVIYDPAQACPVYLCEVGE